MTFELPTVFTCRDLVQEICKLLPLADEQALYMTCRDLYALRPLAQQEHEYNNAAFKRLGRDRDWPTILALAHEIPLVIVAKGASRAGHIDLLACLARADPDVLRGKLRYLVQLWHFGFLEVCDETGPPKHNKRCGLARPIVKLPADAIESCVRRWLYAWRKAELSDADLLLYELKSYGLAKFLDACTCAFYGLVPEATQLVGDMLPACVETCAYFVCTDSTRPPNSEIVCEFIVAAGARAEVLALGLSLHRCRRVEACPWAAAYDACSQTVDELSDLDWFDHAQCALFIERASELVPDSKYYDDCRLAGQFARAIRCQTPLPELPRFAGCKFEGVFLLAAEVGDQRLLPLICEQIDKKELVKLGRRAHKAGQHAFVQALCEMEPAASKALKHILAPTKLHDFEHIVHMVHDNSSALHQLECGPGSLHDLVKYYRDKEKEWPPMSQPVMRWFINCSHFNKTLPKWLALLSGNARARALRLILELCPDSADFVLEQALAWPATSEYRPAQSRLVAAAIQRGANLIALVSQQPIVAAALRLNLIVVLPNTLSPLHHQQG